MHNVEPSEKECRCAADASTQVAFDELEQVGELVRIGEYLVGEDGLHYPVYEDASAVETAIRSLASDGRIIETGAFAPTADGTPQPIFVTREHGSPHPGRRFAVEIRGGYVLVVSESRLRNVPRTQAISPQRWDYVEVTRGPYKGTGGTVIGMVVDADKTPAPRSAGLATRHT